MGASRFLKWLDTNKGNLTLKGQVKSLVLMHSISISGYSGGVI